MRDVYIYDGVRTPFGRHGGILAKVRPDDLLASVLQCIVKKNSINGDYIEEVIAGNSNQAGEDSRNIARNAALISGLPVSVAGITVNRLCGSGMAAVHNAFHAIKCNEGELFIACGVESMSRAPFVMSKADVTYSRTQSMYDSTLGWRFPNKNLVEAYGDDNNSETADNISRELDICREDSDIFAMSSQKKYQTAKLKGYFNEEINVVYTPGARRKDPLIPVNEDEHPRADTTLEKLGKLLPLSEGGVVTAGNASGINDGAAGLLLGSLKVSERFGLKPRAKILGGAVTGVEPRIMGLGPVSATAKVLDRIGLKLKDIDVIEVNEAFANQVLGCMKKMDISFNDSRVNPNGGAIAIGHPLGASGVRLVLTALRHLEATNGKYALATMCIGIGQGIAVIIERFN